MTQKVATSLIAGLAGVLIGGLLALLLLLGGNSSSDGAGTNGVCSQQTVSAAGQPPLTQYYIAAAAKYDLGGNGYAYLAAINKIETGFGTNMATSSAGAIGWMQFEPATFAEYAVSVTNPGKPADPDDPQDAIYSAANMMHADGAPSHWSKAIYAYNHAAWYVQEVEQAAASFMGPQGLSNLSTAISSYWGGKTQPTWSSAQAVDVSATGAQSSSSSSALASACGEADQQEALDVQPVAGSAAVIMPTGLARPPKKSPVAVQAMIDAGDRITGFDYQWGGGHADPALSDSLSNPDPQGGSEPGQNGTPGYDCSGSTDYVLWGGGFGQSVLQGSDPASGELMVLGASGADPKGWATWYASADHVYIEVAGIVFDTVPGPTTVEPKGAPSTGPRWASAAQINYEFTYDGAFTPRHVAGL
jgi:hypothetical protein